jgi:hypothetical protein
MIRFDVVAEGEAEVPVGNRPVGQYEVTSLTGRVLGRTVDGSPVQRAGAVQLAASKLGGVVALDAEGFQIDEQGEALYAEVKAAQHGMWLASRQSQELTPNT